MAVIRAATFNMRHGALSHPKAWRGRRGLVKQAFEQFDVDVLALQEVDRYVWRSGFQDQVKAVAKSTGMRAFFARTLFEQGGLYGNALLVRGDAEISSKRVVPLEHDHKTIVIRDRRVNYAREPRNAIIASLKLDGIEFSVAATHLAGSKELRQRQLETVMGALACYPGAKLLLGDLNTAHPELLAWGSMGSMLLASNGNTQTNPAPNPSRHIDHIGVEGLAVQSVQTRLLPVSDHMALVAELALPVAT